MRNIYDLTKEELEEYFLSIGEKKFKALQILSWLYVKKITDFDLITDKKGYNRKNKKRFLYWKYYYSKS